MINHWLSENGQHIFLLFSSSLVSCFVTKYWRYTQRKTTTGVKEQQLHFSFLLPLLFISQPLFFQSLISFTGCSTFLFSSLLCICRQRRRRRRYHSFPTSLNNCLVWKLLFSRFDFSLKNDQRKLPSTLTTIYHVKLKEREREDSTVLSLLVQSLEKRGIVNFFSIPLPSLFSLFQLTIYFWKKRERDFLYYLLLEGKPSKMIRRRVRKTKRRRMFSGKGWKSSKPL